jgi:CreA protein
MGAGFGSRKRGRLARHPTRRDAGGLPMSTLASHQGAHQSTHRSAWGNRLEVLRGYQTAPPSTPAALPTIAGKKGGPPWALAATPGNHHLRGATEDAMVKVTLLAAIAVTCLWGAAASVRADDLSCVSTTFRLIGKNDRVCVSAFDDPKVPGVACHVSQARTGGLSGTIGLAEDPSRFSIACRQVGPIHVDLASLTDREEVYTARTSIFFKRTHVYRVLDKKRNTLVYLAISDKLIEGSPQNAISTVPIMPWMTER